MSDQEEKISDIEVPEDSSLKHQGQDTVNVVIHYEAADDSSSAKGIDLTICKGRTLALIGEPDLGRVTFKLPVTDLEKIGITMVFQDPNSVLNPALTVKEQIVDIMIINQHLSRKVAVEKAEEVLRMVGFSESRQENYPHEFSDEMKQRIVIAAALAHAPKLLIANETSSPLDMTVKIQLLELLKNIVTDSDMAMLLITRDTSLASQICDNIAVL